MGSDAFRGNFIDFYGQYFNHYDNIYTKGCSLCSNTGKLIADINCDACGGSGTVTRGLCPTCLGAKDCDNCTNGYIIGSFACPVCPSSTKGKVYVVGNDCPSCITCSECKGLGKDVYGNICERCGGNRFISYESKISYNIELIDGEYYVPVLTRDYVTTKVGITNENILNKFTYKADGTLGSDVISYYKENNIKSLAQIFDYLNKENKTPGKFTISHIRAKNSEYFNTKVKTQEHLAKNEIIFANLKGMHQIFDNNARFMVDATNGIFDYIRLFKTPYLITAGLKNFVNLSTIPIYSYTIQSITLDRYERNGEGNLIIEEYLNDNGKINLDLVSTTDFENTNNVHKIKNKMYITNGTKGKNYVGDTGTIVDANYSYIDNDIYNDKIEFTRMVEGLTYLEDASVPDNTVLADVLLAENTLMLFEGVDDEDKEGYSFAGWYEQKFSRVTETWSNLELMSTDKNYPYVSVATADTIMVAIYKKVHETTVTFNEQELSVQYSSATASDDYTTIDGNYVYIDVDGVVDGLGSIVRTKSPVYYNKDYGYKLFDQATEITTIYKCLDEVAVTKQYVEVSEAPLTYTGNTMIIGNFYFDSNVNLVVLPIGGYMFDDFSLNYLANGETINISKNNLTELNDLSLGETMRDFIKEELFQNVVDITTPNFIKFLLASNALSIKGTLSDLEDGQPIRKEYDSQNYDNTKVPDNVNNAIKESLEDFNNFSYNSSFIMSVNPKQIIEMFKAPGEDDDKNYYHTGYNLANLTLNSKKLMAVAVEIEGYYGVDYNDANHNGIKDEELHYGYDFAIVDSSFEGDLTLSDLDNNLDKVYAYTYGIDAGSKKLYVKYNLRDSANNLLSVNLKVFNGVQTESDKLSYTMYMTGYFDYSLSNKLKVLTIINQEVAQSVDASLYQWQINGYETYTSLLLDQAGNTVFENSQNFDVCFEYTDPLKAFLNSNKYFALGVNNSAYVMTALIQSKTKLYVGNTIFDSYSNLNENYQSTARRSHDTNLALTLNISGLFYDSMNNGEAESGNIFKVAKHGDSKYENYTGYINNNPFDEYIVASSAQVLLQAPEYFDDVDEEGVRVRYIFAGWYYKVNIDGKNDENEEDKIALVSTQLSYTPLNPQGYFEARYVKAIKVEIYDYEPGEKVDKNYSTYTFFNTTEQGGVLTHHLIENADKTDEELFILSGATLNIELIPGEKCTSTLYQVQCDKNHDHTKEICNTENKVEINSGLDKETKNENKYSVDINESQYQYKIHFTRNITITIARSFYSDILMNGVPEKFDSVLISKRINGNDYRNFEEFILSDHLGADGEEGKIDLGSGSLDFDGSSYFFIGIYEMAEDTGEMALCRGNEGNSNEAYQYRSYNLVIKQLSTKDYYLEARFVKQANFEIISENVDSATLSIDYNNYGFNLSNQNVSINNGSTGSTTKFEVPHGLKVTLDNPQPKGTNSVQFVYYSRPSQVIKYKNATINVTDEVIKVHFAIASGITVNRNITLSDFDDDAKIDSNGSNDLSNLNNDFKTLFDVQIQFYAPEATSLSSLNIGTNDSQIIVASTEDGKIIKIKPILNSVVRNRYMLASISVKFNNDPNEERVANSEATISFGSKTTLTESGVTPKEYGIKKPNSIDITVNFVPIRTINISTEINGVNENENKFASSLINLSYTLDGELLAPPTLPLTTNTSSTLVITAPILRGYSFIGWYNADNMLTSNNELTLDSSFDNYQYNLIARYKTLANITFEEIVDGESKELGDIKLSANVVSGGINNDGSVEILGKDNFSGLQILSNTNIGLFAPAYDDKIFVGFKFLINGSEISDYYYTGSAIITERNLYYLANLVDIIKLKYQEEALDSTPENIIYLIDNEINLTIQACYEKSYKVNYSVVNVIGEKQSASVDKTFISNQTLFISDTLRTISFKTKEELNNKFVSIFVNGTKVEIGTEEGNVEYDSVNKVYSYLYSDTLQDVVIELRYNNKVNISAYLAFNGLNTVPASLAGKALYFQHTDGNYSTVYNGETDYLYHSKEKHISELVKIKFRANDGVGISDITTVDPSLHFVGWFLYDGESIATSNQLFSLNEELAFVVTDNLCLVAKYETKNPTTEIKTQYSLEFNKTTESAETILESDFDNESLSSADGLYAYSGKTYIFAGYYAIAKANFNSDELTYVKVSEALEYSYESNVCLGSFSNIVARFIEVNTTTFEVNDVTKSYVFYNLTPFYPNLSSETLKTTQSSNTLTFNYVGNVNPADATNYALNDKTGFNTTDNKINVNVNNDRINNIEIGTEDGINISSTDKESVIVKVEIVGTKPTDVIQSTTVVNVLSLNDLFNTISFKTLNGAVESETVPAGSILSLCYISSVYTDYEMFVKFIINGVEYTQINVLYYIPYNVDVINIQVQFKKISTIVITPPTSFAPQANNSEEIETVCEDVSTQTKLTRFSLDAQNYVEEISENENMVNEYDASEGASYSNKPSIKTVAPANATELKYNAGISEGCVLNGTENNLTGISIEATEDNLYVYSIILGAKTYIFNEAFLNDTSMIEGTLTIDGSNYNVYYVEDEETGYIFAFFREDNAEFVTVKSDPDNETDTIIFIRKVFILLPDTLDVATLIVTPNISNFTIFRFDSFIYYLLGSGNIVFNYDVNNVHFTLNGTEIIDKDAIIKRLKEDAQLSGLSETEILNRLNNGDLYITHLNDNIENGSTFDFNESVPELEFSFDAKEKVKIRVYVEIVKPSNGELKFDSSPSGVKFYCLKQGIDVNTPCETHKGSYQEDCPDCISNINTPCDAHGDKYDESCPNCRKNDQILTYYNGSCFVSTTFEVQTTGLYYVVFNDESGLYDIVEYYKPNGSGETVVKQTLTTDKKLSIRTTNFIEEDGVYSVYAQIKEQAKEFNVYSGYVGEKDDVSTYYPKFEISCNNNNIWVPIWSSTILKDDDFSGKIPSENELNASLNGSNFDVGIQQAGQVGLYDQKYHIQDPVLRSLKNSYYSALKIYDDSNKYVGKIYYIYYLTATGVPCLHVKYPSGIEKNNFKIRDANFQAYEVTINDEKTYRFDSVTHIEEDPNFDLEHEFCVECNGSGDQVCFLCGGDGNATCALCHGEGTFKCTLCNPQPNKDGVIESDYVCNTCGIKNPTDTNRDPIDENTGGIICYRCSGDGRMACYECGGDGDGSWWSWFSDCENADCSQTSDHTVQCTVCNGLGRIPCPNDKTHVKISSRSVGNCVECNGTGEHIVKCNYCTEGFQNCSNCGGNGFWGLDLWPCDQCNKGNTDSRPGKRPCLHCGGKGYTKDFCTECIISGINYSTGRCKQCYDSTKPNSKTGLVKCKACGDNKEVICSNCERDITGIERIYCQNDGCGIDLTNIEEANCPECNTPKPTQKSCPHCKTIIPPQAICDECNSSGRLFCPNTKAKDCPECGATGTVSTPSGDVVRCPICEGTKTIGSSSGTCNNGDCTECGQNVTVTYGDGTKKTIFVTGIIISDCPNYSASKTYGSCDGQGRLRNCDRCGGDGIHKNFFGQEKTCPRCGGSGVPVDAWFQKVKDCPHCADANLAPNSLESILDLINTAIEEDILAVYEKLYWVEDKVVTGCTACGGSGNNNKGNLVSGTGFCLTCKVKTTTEYGVMFTQGDGTIPCEYCTGLVRCQLCLGTGDIPCNDCGGDGWQFCTKADCSKLGVTTEEEAKTICSLCYEDGYYHQCPDCNKNIMSVKYEIDGVLYNETNYCANDCDLVFVKCPNPRHNHELGENSYCYECAKYLTLDSKQCTICGDNVKHANVCVNAACAYYHYGQNSSRCSLCNYPTQELDYCTNNKCGAEFIIVTTCQKCGGTLDSNNKCESCAYVSTLRSTNFCRYCGGDGLYDKCTTCNGDGIKKNKTCTDCKGLGHQLEETTLCAYCKGECPACYSKPEEIGTSLNTGSSTGYSPKNCPTLYFKNGSEKVYLSESVVTDEDENGNTITYTNGFKVCKKDDCDTCDTEKTKSPVFRFIQYEDAAKNRIKSTSRYTGSVKNDKSADLKLTPELLFANKNIYIDVSRLYVVQFLTNYTDENIHLTLSVIDENGEPASVGEYHGVDAESFVSCGTCDGDGLLDDDTICQICYGKDQKNVFDSIITYKIEKNATVKVEITFDSNYDGRDYVNMLAYQYEIKENDPDKTNYMATNRAVALKRTLNYNREREYWLKFVGDSNPRDAEVDGKYITASKLKNDKTLYSEPLKSVVFTPTSDISFMADFYNVGSDQRDYVLSIHSGPNSTEGGLNLDLSLNTNNPYSSTSTSTGYSYFLSTPIFDYNILFDPSTSSSYIDNLYEKISNPDIYCADCNSFGYLATDCPDCSDGKEVCETCNNSKVVVAECDIDNCSIAEHTERVTCPTCNGSGSYRGNTCSMCNGKKEVHIEKCPDCEEWPDDKPCETCAGLKEFRTPCYNCNKAGSNDIDCQACNDFNKSSCVLCGGDGFYQNLVTCGTCSGTGIKDGAFCPTCIGSGAQSMTPDCEDCEDGKIIYNNANKCYVCDGDGKLDDNSNCPECATVSADLSQNISSGCNFNLCPLCGGDQKLPNNNNCEDCINGYIRNAYICSAEDCNTESRKGTNFMCPECFNRGIIINLDIKRCEICDGTGSFDGNSCVSCGGIGVYKDCLTCGTDGYIADPCPDCDHIVQTCPTCNGTAYNNGIPCDFCEKTGTVCAECSGAGCETCNNSGIPTCDVCIGTGIISYQCTLCSGSGKISEDPCENCKGTGSIKEICEECRGFGIPYCSSCNNTYKQYPTCSSCEGRGCEKCSFVGYFYKATQYSPSYICTKCNGLGSVIEKNPTTQEDEIIGCDACGGSENSYGTGFKAKACKNCKIIVNPNTTICPTCNGEDFICAINSKAYVSGSPYSQESVHLKVNNYSTVKITESLINHSVSNSNITVGLEESKKGVGRYYLNDNSLECECSCPTCNGTNPSCSTCGGNGKKADCSICSGSGIVPFKFKSGNNVTLSVTFDNPELNSGAAVYYFKGFIIKSNKNTTTTNIFSSGGGLLTSSGSTYSFISATTNNKYTDAEITYTANFTIQADTEIIAVFEPTIYVITISSYKYFDDKVNGDLDLNIEDGKTSKEEPCEEHKQTGAVASCPDCVKSEKVTTDSSIITGNLIVEAGGSTAITSQNYPYNDLVGWELDNTLPVDVMYMADYAVPVNQKVFELVMTELKDYVYCEDNVITAFENTFFITDPNLDVNSSGYDSRLELVKIFKKLKTDADKLEALSQYVYFKILAQYVYSLKTAGDEKSKLLDAISSNYMLNISVYNSIKSKVESLTSIKYSASEGETDIDVAKSIPTDIASYINNGTLNNSISNIGNYQSVFAYISCSNIAHKDDPEGAITCHGTADGHNNNRQVLCASKNLTNSLYLFNITNDLSIFVYYKNMSYNISIEISEILSTYVYDDKYNGITNSKTDTYLTYSEEERKADCNTCSGTGEVNNIECPRCLGTGKWRNPSAGTYTYSDLNWNSRTDLNNEPFDTSLVIEDNDPYIYVYNDNDDNCIGYPTKIASSLVDFKKSTASPMKDEHILVYKSNSSNNVKVKYAKTSAGAFSSGGYLRYTNNLEKIGTINGDNEYLAYDYESNYAYRANDGFYGLENIYNYIYFASGSTTPTLRNDLFYVKISGESYEEAYSQSLSEMVDSGRATLNIDLKNQKISVSFNVKATEAGFESISIYTVNNPYNPVHKNNGNELNTTYLPKTITSPTLNLLTNYDSATYGTPSDSVGGAYLQGYYTGEIENVTMPDSMNLNAVLTFRQQSLPIDVAINYDKYSGNNKISLTGPNSNPKSDLSKLECRGRCFGEASPLINTHKYQIQSAFVVIVNDGQLIVDMLKSIAFGYVKPLIKEYSSTEELIIKQAASMLANQIMNLSAGRTTSNGGIYNISNMTTNTSGISNISRYTEPEDTKIFTYSISNSLLGEINEDTLKRLLKDYFNYEVTERTLAYRVIDTFEYYKNYINYNFYGNYMNSNDLIFVQSILTEHYEPQENIAYTEVFWSDTPIIWKANKPFTYYKNSSISFDSSVNKGTYSLGSSNDYEDIQQSSDLKVELNENAFQKAARSFSGYLKASDKYKGTYSRMTTGMICLSVDDFSDSTTNSVNAYINISSKASDRVVSQVFNYTHVPLLNMLFGCLVAINILGAMLVSGPMGALIIAGSYLIVDGIGENSAMDNILNAF